MLDKQEILCVRSGARRREMLMYLVLDAAAAFLSFKSALGHGWSPRLFLLILAVPAGLLGVGMVISLLLAGRTPRLTMDREGIGVDSDGRRWRCAWADVVWVGVVGDLTQLPGIPVLVAKLGPEAPPVGRSISSPPASLPDTDMVIMLNLAEIIGNPGKVIAAARNISGTKWRA
jgi:hypothetical protein